MDLWLCPACKAQNTEDEKYCRKCGTWLMSTKFPAKKIKGTSPASNHKMKGTTTAPNHAITQNWLISFYVFEAVVILLLGLFIWANSNNYGTSNHFSGFLFLAGLFLITSSVIHTIISLLNKTFKSNKIRLLTHFVLAIILAVTGMYTMDTDSASTFSPSPKNLPLETQSTETFVGTQSIVSSILSD